VLNTLHAQDISEAAFQMESVDNSFDSVLSLASEANLRVIDPLLKDIST
jgi:hypothetical protein